MTVVVTIRPGFLLLVAGSLGEFAELAERG